MACGVFNGETSMKDQIIRYKVRANSATVLAEITDLIPCGECALWKTPECKWKDTPEYDDWCSYRQEKQNGMDKGDE